MSSLKNVFCFSYSLANPVSKSLFCCRLAAEGAQRMFVNNQNLMDAASRIELDSLTRTAMSIDAGTRTPICGFGDRCATALTPRLHSYHSVASAGKQTKPPRSLWGSCHLNTVSAPASELSFRYGYSSYVLLPDESIRYIGRLISKPYRFVKTSQTSSLRP